MQRGIVDVMFHRLPCRGAIKRSDVLVCLVRMHTSGKGGQVRLKTKLRSRHGGGLPGVVILQRQDYASSEIRVFTRRMVPQEGLVACQSLPGIGALPVILARPAGA